ncbi:MAG TPA: hypothetical protein VFK33_15125 [Bacillales bacterium]|nr:hypothetical protein [Bacillales bacterium]
MNVYLKEDAKSYSENVEFQEEIIQLHVHAFPSLKDVFSRPWDFRYTLEARTVSDPSMAFQRFKTETVRYLKSKSGRKKMLAQAEQVVAMRKKWAAESLDAGNLYSAGMAGMAALTDAGIMNAYFVHGLLSSSGFVEAFKKTGGLFAEIKEVLPVSNRLNQLAVDEIMGKVSRYLGFLRSNTDNPDSFPLDSVQEALLRRKVERLKRFGDEWNLFFLMYGEIFWFWLSGSREETFEEHIQTLPGPICDDMELFGFVKMTPSEVDQLCSLADEWVALTKQNELGEMNRTSGSYNG